MFQKSGGLDHVLRKMKFLYQLTLLFQYRDLGEIYEVITMVYKGVKSFAGEC